MKVCKLVLNSFPPDTRVYKEALTLVEAGHEVTILAAAATDRPEREWLGEIEVVRLDPLRERAVAADVRPAPSAIARSLRCLTGFLSRAVRGTRLRAVGAGRVVLRAVLPAMAMVLLTVAASVSGLLLTPAKATLRLYRPVRRLIRRVPRFLYRLARLPVRCVRRLYVLARSGIQRVRRLLYRLARLPVRCVRRLHVLARSGIQRVGRSATAMVTVLLTVAAGVWGLLPTPAKAVLRRLYRPVLRPMRRGLRFLYRLVQLSIRRVRRPYVLARPGIRRVLRFLHRLVQLPVRRVWWLYVLARSRILRVRRLLVRQGILAMSRTRRRYVLARSRILRVRRLLARRVILATSRTRRLYVLARSRLQRVRRLLTRQGILAMARIRRTSIAQTWRRFQHMRAFRRAILQEIARRQPDVIHAHDLLCLQAGVMGARLVGAHLVYDAHEMEWDCNRIQQSWLLRFFWRLHEAAFIRQADGFVTVSPRIAELYRRRYGIPRPAVLPNAPLEEWTSCNRDVPSLRSQIPAADEKTLVLYVGGVTRDRGALLMLETLAHLPEHFVFVTLGNISPAVHADLLERAAGLGVAERFFALPPVNYDDVCPVAAEADLGVIPVLPAGASYRFCLPNKLFEMINAGLPLVVGPLPDVEDVVVSNGIGVACRQNSPEAFAQGLLHVSQNRQAYRPSPSRLQELVRSYCWEAHAQSLVSLYLRLEGTAPNALKRTSLPGYCRPTNWLKASRSGPDPEAVVGWTGLPPIAVSSVEAASAQGAESWQEVAA